MRRRLCQFAAVALGAGIVLATTVVRADVWNPDPVSQALQQGGAGSIPYMGSGGQVQASTALPGALQFNVSGTPTTYLNTLANTVSPILSPELANSPLATNSYQPFGAVIGYSLAATSSTPNTYAEMDTLNLSVSGTITNHLGRYESTLNITGASGAFLNDEINDHKSYILSDANTQISTGENFEAIFEIGGTLSGFAKNYTAAPILDSGAAITGGFEGYNFRLGNSSSHNNFAAYALDCDESTGTELAVGWGFCVANLNPRFDILNEGHYVTRSVATSGTYANTPTIANGALTTGGTDVAGIVTLSSGQTVATITFGKAYSNNLPVPQVTSLTSGSTCFAALANISETAFQVTCSAAAASFSYMVMGTH